MKTQNRNTLDFKTQTLLELSDNDISTIQGGATTFICGECISVPTMTLR